MPSSCVNLFVAFTQVEGQRMDGWMDGQYVIKGGNCRVMGCALHENQPLSVSNGA